MADRLSDEQVSEIAEVLSATKAGEQADAPGVARLLRESQQTAFSEAELVSIEAAISALDRPLAERTEWSATNKRGFFFVFEGLDRSGKSTQSKRLAKHLESSGSVKWTCFPNRKTAVGTLIDLYLRRKIELSDETVHQLFSANRWEMAESIVEDLNQGTSIVCDRYAFSGVAYSASKGLDFTWCQDPDRGLPVPDGVFFLHIDEKVGASRADYGDERYENADMQGRVRNEFQRQDLRANVAWHDVDGARDIEVITRDIFEAVEAIRQVEQENGAVPIQRLWVP